MMKSWVKVLMWVGLGAGLGFFAGFQIGNRSRTKEEEADETAYEIEREAEAQEAMDIYRAEEQPKFTQVEEEPDMPMEPVAIGDEDVVENRKKEPAGNNATELRQLHPQHLVPQIITEDEFAENPWDEDQEDLIFYTVDEVLYNLRTQTVITEPDEVIGVGMLYALDSHTDRIFIRNETLGTLFRILKVEDAFADVIDGQCSPGEDDGEEEVTEEDEEE